MEPEGTIKRRQGFISACRMRKSMVSLVYRGKILVLATGQHGPVYHGEPLLWKSSHESLKNQPGFGRCIAVGRQRSCHHKVPSDAHSFKQSIRFFLFQDTRWCCLPSCWKGHIQSHEKQLNINQLRFKTTFNSLLGLYPIYSWHKF